MASRFAGLLLTAACFAASAGLVSCSEVSGLPVERLSILAADGRSVGLDTELARTRAEQEKGYMQRKNIPDGTGMIFIYTADTQLNFWMKNTPHPLSIAFIDSSGAIREIRDMAPFSLETVSSEGSVRYALEVPSGWFGRAGLGIGDRLSAESLGILAGR